MSLDSACSLLNSRSSPWLLNPACSALLSQPPSHNRRSPRPCVLRRRHLHAHPGIRLLCHARQASFACVPSLCCLSPSLPSPCHPHAVIVAPFQSLWRSYLSTLWYAPRRPLRFCVALLALLGHMLGLRGSPLHPFASMPRPQQHPAANPDLIAGVDLGETFDTPPFGRIFRRVSCMNGQRGSGPRRLRCLHRHARPLTHASTRHCAG